MPDQLRTAWRGVLSAIALSLCVVFLIDAALFRTRFYYTHIAEPNSFAGAYERNVRNERARPVDGRKQVLFVGDSRALAFRPRIAESLVGREFAFGNAAVQGSDARDWYYLLRDVDPGAHRYSAILIGLSDFDDEDTAEEPADRLLDWEIVSSSLRLSDIADFPFSFRSASHIRTAALGCMFKGTAMKKDLFGFLAHPKHRWNDAAIYRERAVREDWASTGPTTNLTGLRADWPAKQIQFPSTADSFTRQILSDQVEHPAYPQTGLRAEFNRRWLPRIADRYRGSETVLVFLRMVRSPIRRPDSLAPSRPPGVVRSLATRPNIVLADEHAFESLETPELFCDWSHLNNDGWERATRIVVHLLSDALQR